MVVRPRQTDHAVLRGLERDVLQVHVAVPRPPAHYAGKFRGEISSNGPLRGQKSDVFEGGHRVPAIVRWPGRVPADKVSAETVMTMDLLPTMLELADVTVKTPLDGVSIAPLLLQGKSIAPRTLFWRDGKARAARRGRWKLVMTEKHPAPMLFDLEADLGERRDLAADPVERRVLAVRHEELIASLSGALKAWEADVDRGFR